MRNNQKCKVNIGFLIYSLDGGGAERMVSRLANGMYKRGINVSIIIFEDRNRAYDINPEISVYIMDVKRRSRIMRTFSRIKQIHNYIKKEGIDVLFAFTISMVPFAILSSMGTKCKIIGTERTNPKCLKRKYKICIPLFASFCKGYVFQTSGAMKCYPKKCQAKGVVIGNIAPCIEEIEVFPKEPLTICSAGRLHTDKDFETLIRAFKKVNDTIAKTKLDIYGDGPQKKELIDLAEKLNIAQNINFKGFTRQLSKELSKYSIFVFSSKAEGMPNTLMEAMAMGLSCVSTDCEFGPSELIDDGVNGYLVKVKDFDQMAMKIIYLLRNDEIRKSMGIRAKEISEKYSEDNIINAYIGYVTEVLKGE